MDAVAVIIRSTRRHGDRHPSARHLHPERRQHPGAAGEHRPALCLIGFEGREALEPLSPCFGSLCRKCWTTSRRKETSASSRVCLGWWCLAGTPTRITKTELSKKDPGQRGKNMIFCVFLSCNFVKPIIEIQVILIEKHCRPVNFFRSVHLNRGLHLLQCNNRRMHINKCCRFKVTGKLLKKLIFARGSRKGKMSDEQCSCELKGEQLCFICLSLSSPSSVLDLNAFERQNKAEGLGMVTEEGSSKWL